MRIAEGLEMLELVLNMGERTMVIHPSVLFDSNGWVLVDTGMPGSSAQINKLVQEAGISGEAPQVILLTHQDIDHVGGLPGYLFGTNERPLVYAHENDKGAIDGAEPMIKVSPERRTHLLAGMTEPVRSAFEKTFIHPEQPNVSRTFADGERLPYGGGLVVIHTPGHTPGHVSLYHEASRTLIAGDAMVVADGELRGPNPANTPNMPEALNSLGKLKAYDIETVICFHGGLYRGEANKRIAELHQPS
jgi:glyoxylase-like metal-dependent hydrolase (beta-lactamase superfamily II)